jgi:MerR family mercuric resistance operon transcriptional regulator
MTLLTIGKIAKQTGVTVEAVRFYEKQGLIAEPQRTESGYRQYPPDTIKRVHFIQRAKEAGFTLKDIGELLKLRREPGTTCTDIKLRALEKINEVDQKIKDLQRIKESLEQMVLRCSDTEELDECPILETLEFDERI